MIGSICCVRYISYIHFWSWLHSRNVLYIKYIPDNSQRNACSTTNVVRAFVHLKGKLQYRLTNSQCQKYNASWITITVIIMIIIIITISPASEGEYVLISNSCARCWPSTPRGAGRGAGRPMLTGSANGSCICRVSSPRRTRYKPNWS